MAVPEADRGVNKLPIYFEKKKAIAAIPVIDEDGEEVHLSRDENENHYKQSVFEMQELTAKKLLQKADDVEPVLNEDLGKARNASSVGRSKSHSPFG